MKDSTIEKCWNEMGRHTDGHAWYWLSYGEKCYAFATVTAFPLDDDAPYPPSGGRLEVHPEKERLWVAEDGTEMIVDDWLTNIEQQNGDVICQFIAQAFADCEQRFGAYRAGGKIEGTAAAQ